MTSGEEPLAIPPIKDVGFPYQSFQDVRRARRRDRPRDDAVHLAAVHDRQRRVRTLGERGLARRAASRLRPLPHVGPVAGHRGGDDSCAGASRRCSLRSAGERWRIDVADSTGPRRCIGATRWRSPARASTGRSRTTPTPRRGSFTATAGATSWRASPSTRAATSRSSAAARARSAASRSCAPSGPAPRLTVYTPSLPLSRGESFLENRVFSNPDEVAWSALDPQTRRDFVKHCDRGVFDPGDAGEHRLRRSLPLRHRSRDARRRRAGATRRARSVRRLRSRRRVSRAPATTTWSTAPASICLEQLRALFSPARARGDRGSGRARCGTVRPRRRFRSGATSSWRECARGCTYRDWRALSQGPGFANLGCSGCSPTVCWSRCSARRTHRSTQVATR